MIEAPIHRRRKVWNVSPATFLSYLCVALVSFQLGLLAGGSTCDGGRRLQVRVHGPLSSVSMEVVPLASRIQPLPAEATANDLIVEQRTKIDNVVEQLSHESKDENVTKKFVLRDKLSNPLSTTPRADWWPAMFSGAARVPADSFAALYDTGVPLDGPVPANKEVLILYSDTSAMPWNRSTSSNVPRYTSAEEATENCHIMKVILQEPGHTRQHCMAIVNQWSSGHVHNFMRLPPETGRVVDWKAGTALDERLPMRYVSRYHQPNGVQQDVPNPNDMQTYHAVLGDYLSKLADTKARLRPIVKAVAGKQKALIVMVCNLGQSELLLNFVCAAKSRNQDLSKVLLFATDEATADLAIELGLTVFPVGDAFGPMPQDAAEQYGDLNFSGMMLAKVYTVHLVNSLGYDLLFCDVDLIWRSNPLDYFLEAKMQDYDIVGQEDGSRVYRYAPYSFNTGFYFVRYNRRTVSLMNMLSRMGDFVLLNGSHQEIFTELIAEHASLRGLRVKVLGRDTKDGLQFPGGFHFHRRKDYMKRLMKAKEEPTIFHMSWTKSKDNKKRFFQQMGMWYVQPNCEGLKRENKTLDTTGSGDLGTQCCATEPIMACHFRDKPSKIPCHDLPPIDNGRPSFWQ